MDDPSALVNLPDYVARRTDLPIDIDGDLTKAPWTQAVWSRRFVDMASGRQGMYDTRAAVVWDDTNLYLAFAAEEPFVRAELTERDSIFTDFDLPGLRTAVQVDGTLNDDSDIDGGWSLEIAIPWSSLALLADGRPVPPQHGDEWRMFLGRFQRLELSGNEVLPHPAMALNSHGIYDTHQPNSWSRIRFEH